MNNKYVLIALSLCSVGFVRGVTFKLEDTSMVGECSVSYTDNSNQYHQTVINKGSPIKIDLENIGDRPLYFGCLSGRNRYPRRQRIYSKTLANNATYEIINSISLNEILPA